MINIFYKIKNKINFPLKLLFQIIFILIAKNYSKYPKYVLDFERKLCSIFNSKFSLTFSSGSAACYSAIASLYHKRGSLAFVSKLTFPSTIISLLENNYVIKYLDFDLNFNPIFPKNITPDLIIFTHVFGFPVGFNSLEEIRRQYKDTKIIFDCSHFQGAIVNDKNINEYADISFFSIQGSKAISGGEGGFILTNNQNYYNRMIMIAHPGRANSEIESKYTGVSSSLKLRMHPIAAILANESLNKLNKHNNDIKMKFEIIYKILSEHNLIKVPNIQNLSLGGFHYGLPFYSEKNFTRNIFLPINSYNWPFYEKNDFYSLEIFNSDDFIKREEKYLEINNFVRENSDIRSRLFFIDLNWIKFNSERYLINSVEKFLKSLK